MLIMIKIISIKKYNINIMFKEAIICGILLMHYSHINKYKFECPTSRMTFSITYKLIK